MRCARPALEDGDIFSSPGERGGFGTPPGFFELPRISIIGLLIFRICKIQMLSVLLLLSFLFSEFYSHSFIDKVL